MLVEEEGDSVEVAVLAEQTLALGVDVGFPLIEISPIDATISVLVDATSPITLIDQWSQVASAPVSVDYVLDGFTADNSYAVYADGIFAFFVESDGDGQMSFTYTTSGPKDVHLSVQ